MSSRRGSSRLVVGLLLLLTGCQHPFVPLKNYTRTEPFDLAHTRWLHAHCDLVGVSQASQRGHVSSDLGNYVQLIGIERQVFADNSSLHWDAALVYACSEPTPWDREDRGLVRVYHRREVEAGRPLRDRCDEKDIFRPAAKFEVVERGAGEAPTRDSYVRYRITPVVTVRASQKDEADGWGVTPGERRSWETANHILCSSFRDALLSLKRGGTAHVSSLEKSGRSEGFRGHSEMLEWNIELLEIGSVELLYDQVGLVQP